MSATPPWGNARVRRLVEPQQIDDWVATLRDRRGGLLVLHSNDRRREAMLLATHLGGVTSELTASPTGTWETHDIALAVVSHSAESDPPPMLPVLLHGGVLVYGLTGPRPNAVADHSHDSLALPITDPDELLSAQRLVIRRLIAATENGQ